LAAECTWKDDPKCLTQEAKVAYLQNTNFARNVSFKILVLIVIMNNYKYNIKLRYVGPKQVGQPST